MAGDVREGGGFMAILGVFGGGGEGGVRLLLLLLLGCMHSRPVTLLPGNTNGCEQTQPSDGIGRDWWEGRGGVRRRATTYANKLQILKRQTGRGPRPSGAALAVAVGGAALPPLVFQALPQTLVELLPLLPVCKETRRPSGSGQDHKVENIKGPKGNKNTSI